MWCMLFDIDDDKNLRQVQNLLQLQILHIWKSFQPYIDAEYSEQFDFFDKACLIITSL